MSQKNELRRLVSERFQVKQNRLAPIPGTMGNGYGVVSVPGRPNYVYVRIADNVEEVFCNRIPPENDLLVLVGYDAIQPNVYQVLSTRSYTPMGVTGGAIGGYAPARRYQWMADGGGEDPLWVDTRQFLPLRIGVYNGLFIQVYRGFIYTGTVFKLVDSQIFDLTSFIPSSAALTAYVLISIDNTGTIVGTKGSEVGGAYPDFTYIPDPPAGTIDVLGAVRVYYGQTVIQENRTDTDIIDLRFTKWGGESVTLSDHAHAGIAGDGGRFPLDNLLSSGATIGQVPTADGSGAILWSDGGGLEGWATAANATSYLTTPTYDGSNKTTHVDVYYNAAGWNGYKYWMANSPFPSGNVALENPCILTSADGTTWAAPTGIANPIDAAPVTGHNADPDIIVGQDNVMYCYYIEAQLDTDIRAKMRSSADGVTWSAENALFTEGYFASPAVIWDGTQYVMYSINYSASPHTIKRRTCATPGGTWSAASTCTVTGIPLGQEIWHLDVVKRPGAYHAFITMKLYAHPLYFAISLDGITWEIDSNYLLTAGVAGQWDDGFLYRSSGVPTSYGYDLFYAGNDDPTSWVNPHIGRSPVYLSAEILGEAVAHDPVTATDTATIDLTLTGQALTADLKNTTVTPGSYAAANITVDAQGRLTAAASGSGSGGGELLMQDGVSSPPVPLMTEDGTDWIYQG